jgi:hypothetical protein
LKHTRLTKAYKAYNKKYFGNRLENPPDVIVKWEESDENLLGYQLGDTIAINRKYRYADSIWKMTLLHEMVHMDTPYAPPHGTVFQKKMLRLARMGAFKGLW